jgi:RNA polymerase sigma factor (sigma-70 family)
VSRSSIQPQRLGEADATGRIARGAALMASRGPDFARTARRFSLSPEDAEDALGRAVEILLRKAPEREPGALAAWMQVVTRREALAVSRRAFRLPVAPRAGGTRLEPDSVPTPDPGPEQEAERRERVAEVAARLAELKPQERRAIALQAAGCSYAEIQAVTGWTYTKVNRCITEGREALRVSRLEPA